jgi:hypothetical protein
VIATHQRQPVPLHDLYRFRRSGDGAEVVYCCPAIHLTTNTREIQERGAIVGCRYTTKDGWLSWDGGMWRDADSQVSKTFEKLPVLGDIPH